MRRSPLAPEDPPEHPTWSSRNQPSYLDLDRCSRHTVLAYTCSPALMHLLEQLDLLPDGTVFQTTQVASSGDAVEQWRLRDFDALVVDTSLDDAWATLDEIRSFTPDRIHPVLVTEGLARPDGAGVYALPQEVLFWEDLDLVSLLRAIRHSAVVNRATRALRETSDALHEMQDGLIDTLLYALELHDPITARHQRRVGDLVLPMARQLRLSDLQCEYLVIAAKLHDIGKIVVPSEIVSKPSSLSATETAIVRSHVDAGHDVLVQANLPASITDAVHQHHERLDGSGYPLGLIAEHLAIPSQILAVADVFEAMTAHRPYRPAFPERDALRFLRDEGRAGFDPVVVATLSQVLRKADDWATVESVSISMSCLTQQRVLPGDTPGGIQAYLDRTEILTSALGRPLTEAVVAMASQAEMKDAYTAGHQRRVTDLAAEIGSRLGLDRSTQACLVTASLLHDIGKVSIPNKILHKSTPLTEAEFELIKEHARAGYELLRPISFPWPVADIVLCHHERGDGSGYPAGLEGDAIPLEARIIAVADTAEAITCDRPYRPALGVDRAVEELRRGLDILYDSDVVDACIDVLEVWRASDGDLWGIRAAE